jgi:hypothetical protein
VFGVVSRTDSGMNFIIGLSIPNPRDKVIDLGVNEVTEFTIEVGSNRQTLNCYVGVVCFMKRKLFINFTRVCPSVPVHMASCFTEFWSKYKNLNGLLASPDFTSI